MKRMMPAPYQWNLDGYKNGARRTVGESKEDWSVAEWEFHVHDVKSKLYSKMLLVCLVSWAMGVKLGAELILILVGGRL